MKNILILFMLILSTTLFGQKPDNHLSDISYEISYNDNCNDKSINLSSYKIPENKISELLKIFEIADKLDNYCNDKTVEINKFIGVIMIEQDSCKIIYLHLNHKGNGIIEFKSQFHYDFFRSHENLLFKPYLNGEHVSFTYYLTTKRDEYYKELADYNNKLKQANADVDAILNNK
jgi:hypothetical protein